MPRNKRPVYSSNIKDMTFLFLETRKASKLVVDGVPLESIILLSVEKNIFQLDKERRRLSLAQKVVSRLSVLTDIQLSAIASASDEIAKLVVFYAIIKTDLLFFEFMKVVYSENQNVGQFEIQDTDIISFLHSKEEIARWTDNNFTRVKNTYKAILCEAGLSSRDDHVLRIHKPITDDLLKEVYPFADDYTEAMGLEL